MRVGRYDPDGAAGRGDAAEEYQDDELGDAAFVDFGEMPDLPDEGLPDTLSEIEDAELPSPENWAAEETVGGCSFAEEGAGGGLYERYGQGRECGEDPSIVD